MKRRVRFLPALALLLLLIVPAVSLPALAGGDFPVADSAELLGKDQQAQLNERAQGLAEKYGCGVYILTVDAMPNGDDDAAAYDYAKQAYKEYKLGEGDAQSGMLLLLSMETRKYALIAYGDGNRVLTDYGRKRMLDDYILPELKENNWYGAFSAYLDRAEFYLEQAEKGEPFDKNTDKEKKPSGVLAGILCGLVPAGITGIFCGTNYSKMKTAKSQSDADYYIPDGGVELTASHDRFLYQDESRVYIDHDDDSGGTTIDSDGFSGSSGSF